MWWVINILVSEPFCWGSGQRQITVSINISWVLVSVLTRKGRSWGRTYPPGSSPGWVRAQLAAPSGLGPETLLSRQCWGSRAPTQLALRLLRPAMWWEVWEQVLQMASQADGAARRWQRRGEGHCLLKAWARPVGATVRALEVSRTQPPTCPLLPQNTHWPAAGWSGAPWGEGWDWLLPHWPLDNPCSSELGWMSSLTVTHWQLLPWGRSPLQMAEQDLLPGDSVQSNSSQVRLCWGLHLAVLCYKSPWQVSIHPCPLQVFPDRN